MCANAFCVKPSGSSIVVFDEEIENYNRILKQTPCMPSLDVTVMRSHHSMAGDKVGKEMWGIPRKRNAFRGTSLEDDVIELKVLMHAVSIFISHTAVPMNRVFFWNFVKPKVGVGSPRDICEMTVDYDEHENK